MGSIVTPFLFKILDNCCSDPVKLAVAVVSWFLFFNSVELLTKSLISKLVLGPLMYDISSIIAVS